MRDFLLICLFVLSAVSTNVQAKAIHRDIRELQLQEVAPELQQEIVDPVHLDLVQPVLVIKEEVLVPVETLQSIAPIAEVDGPGAIVIEDQVNKDENEIIGAGEEHQTPSEEHFPVGADDGLRGDQENVALPEQEQQAILEATSNDELPPVHGVLKQEVSTTARPSLLQQAQQIISNNPFGQFIDSIRRPSTVAPETQQAGVEATTNANIFQQFQAGVQNLGSQITSAFTPPQSNLQASESNPSQTAVRPPNFFEQLQSNLQNTVQGIFRPNPEQSTTTGTQPQGPFQSVLTNVQNFLTGNRGEASAAQTSTPGEPQKVGLPVDDKVDFNKNSGEVLVDNAAESSDPVVAVQQPETSPVAELDVKKDEQDESVVLVAQESSLENESE